MSGEKGDNTGKDNGDVTKEHRRSDLNKLWVPVVILVGAALGALFYVLAESSESFPHFNRFGADTYLEFHIILSTVGMALLVALIVVYAKSYVQTRANFMLGLLVVLFALLLQSVLTYPVLLELEVTPRFEILIFSPVADLFTIIAYTVFLYLSLE
jgi:hypothetical protein